MEQCLENWPLHTEIIEQDDYGRDSFLLLEECLQKPAPTTDDDDNFLREILQMPPPDLITAATAQGKRAAALSSPSPTTFILSFDNSTIIAATPEQQQPAEAEAEAEATTGPKKGQKARRMSPIQHHQQEGAAKKSRNESQIVDHIMAERKRRQQLTQMFIALSATIPGLKKTDKASILGEAINYVKELQERVRELEKGNKKKRGPAAASVEADILLKKSDEQVQVEEQVLPDVEARVLEKEKEVLIEIHCEKENGIEVKILEELENVHHLIVTGSSVLPFGNSTLGITIIAKMDDAYTITLHDLVTNLRQLLFINTTHTHHHLLADPY